MLTGLLVGVILLLVLVMAAVLVTKVTKNPGVIDVVWPVGISLLGTCLLLSHGFSEVILVSLILLWGWGLRLGGFLFFTRVRVGEVERRYTALVKDLPEEKHLGYFTKNFFIQAGLMFLVTLPFWFIDPTTRFTLGQVIAIFIIVFAIYFESLADMQLHSHRKLKDKTVCQSGLWRLSRHPNYFFEFCVWIGFALLATTSLIDLVAFLSPIGLFYIMTKITGPMTEAASLESRGEQFTEYQKTTPYFFINLKKLWDQ